MKKGFEKKIFCMAIILCALCIFGKEQIAYAAENSYVQLGDFWNDNKSKTYKKYDVTGDGVTDKVKISVKDVGESGYDGRLRIYINGKKAFESIAGDYMFWNVCLVSLKNGNKFFEIESLVSSEDVNYHELYKYEDGKLKSFFDFLKNDSKYATHYDVRVYKVKNNTIYAKPFVQFITTGGFLSYNVKYKYKNGKIQRISKEHTILYEPEQKNRWTVNRKIKVYKKPGSKKIRYTLKKGNVIKINKVVYKGKKIYFQIKNKDGKGKTGYIHATTKMPPKKMYFKESFYSG